MKENSEYKADDIWGKVISHFSFTFLTSHFSFLI